MRVEITDLAETDLEQGYLFYELQQVGLGTYFLDALYSDMPRSTALRCYGITGFLFHRSQEDVPAPYGVT